MCDKAGYGIKIATVITKMVLSSVGFSFVDNELVTTMACFEGLPAPTSAMAWFQK